MNMTHEIFNALINIGSFVTLTLGLGVIVSLALGAEVRLAPARRKR